MNMNPDDPKLTAYALGELEPGERAAIEAELRNHPDCRQAVEEIRQAAGLLAKELAVEPCPGLLPGQRQQIRAGLEPQPDNIIAFPFRRWFATAGFAAVAASVLFLLAWQFWLAGPDKGVKELASNNKPLDNKTEAAPKPDSQGVQPLVPLVKSEPAVTAPATTRARQEKEAEVLTVSAPPAERSRGLEKTETVQANLGTTATTTAPTAPVDVKAQPEVVMTLNSFNYEAAKPPTTPQPAVQNAVVNSGTTDGIRYTDGAALGWNGGGAPPAQAQPPVLAADANSTRAFRSELATPGQRSAQPTFDPETRKLLVVTDSSSLSGSQQSSAQGNEQLRDKLVAGVPVAGRGGRRGAIAGGGGGGGGGGFGGGGSGGMSGGSFGVGGGRAVTVAGNTVVTETQVTRTVTYDVDPYRDNFSQWRYYRYPTPLPPPNTASYPQYPENLFQPVMQHPLSTFSVDVDTASYSNVRRFLNAGQLPPRDAVRLEEMLNYFKYKYPAPKGDDPFAATIEVAGCPWEPGNRLVRVGIKGREMARDKRPAGNFVFLIDISGSMSPPERLPLIKQALKQMVRQMGEGDRVAIVVYASTAGVRLSSTPCTEKDAILAAIDSLTAGGSTNGGDGIQQAYREAREHFIEGGVNRVLLCTDGDFNVGMTDQNELVRMIQEKAKSGVYLTTLGVGTDNYKDALMQKLADKGNGNYAYLDNIEEAQKVLIDQMSGTLVTIAKDVKIQVEFNPAKVSSYRLIGYEKRALRNEDFNNDAKDAGEIGAGHTVTALYEVVPVGREFRASVDDLKYQGQNAAPQADRMISTHNKELLTLKLRYKHPEGDRSRLLEFPVTDNGVSYNRASADFKFASAVASFGMLLKESPNRGDANYGTVIELAEESKGADEGGYRAEFITLVKKAQAMTRRF